MNFNFSRFSFPYNVITGTTTIAVIVFASSAAFGAKSPQEILQLANTITVQINEPPGSPVGTAASGSGFIIKQEGNTYTVLTCDHVVNPSKGPKPVVIRTSDGNKYQINGIIKSLGL